MKQTFLSGATLAALVMLVALPLVFILLQAIFPHFSAGSLGDAFGGIPALLADPQLAAMLGGTLWIAAGVALVSVMIGLPLGILRGMFSLPLPRLWDLLFLIPFLTPPYISALSWMLALQSQGYLQQLTGWQLNDLLFSRSGIVLVMTFNIFPVVYFCRLPQPAGERDPAGGGRPRPWRQRLARLLARDATDALSGAGGGDAAGVYPRHRGVWRTGGAGQPGGSGDADGRY